MADQAPSYKPHGVVTIEDGATVFRWLLERPSDGHYAVVHTEFHDPFADPDKRLIDTVTPIADLTFSADDEAVWDFHPTIQGAVAASKNIMIPFSEWMKNARDY